MKQFTKILVTVIAVVSITMLVGLRFGATWAGGDGLERHAMITTPDGTTYHRGETIKATETTQFQIGAAVVHLDVNTEVHIVNAIAGAEVVNVLQGRVVVQGPLTIETRELDTMLDGTTSFVHYSWLDEIDVLNIDGRVRIATGETELTIESGESLHMNTLAPYEIFPGYVDLQSSSAAGFYDDILND